MENLKQLHFIRGIAALYVAIGHSKSFFWSGGKEYLNKFPLNDWGFIDYILFPLDMMTSSAQEMVIVFFVLSGFFITYSFDKNNWTIKNFLINRIIRIYPPYLYSVIISIAVFFYIHKYLPEIFINTDDNLTIAILKKSYADLDFNAMLRALFFLPKTSFIAGNVSYWSLLPEWIFYITAPFIFYKRKWVFLSFTLFYFVNFFLQFNFINPVLKFIFEYGFYFSLGAQFYIYKKRTPNRKVFNKYGSYIIVSVFLILTIVLGNLNIKTHSGLSAAILAVLSMNTLLCYPIKNKIIHKIGNFLGDISYTLYVCHLPFYFLVFAIIVATTGIHTFYFRLYWFIVPFAVLFSYGSYLLIEKRTLIYIKKRKAEKPPL